MAKTINASTYIFRFNSRPDMYEEHTFTFPTKTGPAYFTHSWTLECSSLFGKFSGGGNTPGTSEAVRSFTLPLEEVIRVSTYDQSRNFGKLHIVVMTETSTSVKIRYWVECDQPESWYDSLEWRGTLTCYTRSSPVPTDSKPTHLLCDGSIEPLALRNPTPGLSAVFNDLNGTSKEVQVYVATTGLLLPGDLPNMWDSGWLSAPALEDGKRCSPITYAGPALNMATADYYWIIRFKDTADAISDWSDRAHFRTSEDEDPDPRENTPTGLLCEGEAHPMAVVDQTPEFSAINNLLLTSTHYQIVVAKTLTHGGYFPSKPHIWSSDWQPDATPRWSRCSDKTYGGSALPIDDTTYYWAIRFKTATEDAERTSKWSLAASFKMASSEDPDPTVTGYYRIQVNTQSGFNGTMMWDSGDVPVTVAFATGVRCSPDIEYLGVTLDLTGKVYYWRIQLWNIGDAEHPWSIEEAFFSGEAEEPIPPPDWVTAQHREPIGTAEVELVAGSDDWTNLADVMGITVSNNKNPLDNIETSQATVYLSNIDKLFYSENETSAFYQKLSGRKVRLALGATVEGADDLYRKMTGIIKSTNVNRASMTAEIVALEFLDYYKTRHIRRTPVYKNITVFDLFCNLIKYCFPHWKNQHETADWDYFVSPLGFRRSNLYLGVGDGGASYIIQDNTKTPPETVYNIIADSEAIYKDGVRLERGTDYSITQVDLPQGVESTLVFLKDYPTSTNILYACVTIHTTVEAVQYEDTDLITELEKIALVADCRLYADMNGKLVCRSNELTSVVDAIKDDTHLMSLSSRVDVEDIVNHVVVMSKPYLLAGDRTTLGTWSVEFTRVPRARDGEEHTFEFEYATELLCDLSWSMTCQNVWGEYIGSGIEGNFSLPLDLKVSVRGLWGWFDYGEIHIETLEVDSTHLTVKFWVEVYNARAWYSAIEFEATLTLKGFIVGQPITYVGEAIDEASFHDMWIGEKKQEFTLEYLEPGTEVAQQAAEALLSNLCKLKTYYDCLVRGMPHLRLLDTLTVTEPTALLDAKQTQVIKMVDNLKLGDYRTDLGLVVKEIPVVATPHYWTPEWYEFIISSEATASQTYTWSFNSAILGYYFRHEWFVTIHSPKFLTERVGANYDIDLPYSEMLQIRNREGTLIDFVTLSITLIEATASSVEIRYSLTLAEGFDWTHWSGPEGVFPIAVAFVGKLACIPEFSYEVVGPASLPHYPRTLPFTPSDEQPGSGYYYQGDHYKIAWTFSPSLANIDAWMAALAAGGFNFVQMYNAYYQGTKVYRDACSVAALKYGLRLIPYPGDQEDFDTWKWLQIERKDDAAIWGWQFEEPFAIGSTIPNIQNKYRGIKSINPKWKIFCAFGNSDWYAQGWATSDICDVFGVDIYPCAQSDPKGYLIGKLGLFKSAIRTLVDQYDCEYCPVIMAWSQSTCTRCIRMQYETHADEVQRYIKGLGYYLTSGFLPEAGGLACIWTQIVSMNSILDET